jgi:hypothetical protein
MLTFPSSGSSTRKALLALPRSRKLLGRCFQVQNIVSAHHAARAKWIGQIRAAQGCSSEATGSENERREDTAGDGVAGTPSRIPCNHFRVHVLWRGDIRERAKTTLIVFSARETKVLRYPQSSSAGNCGKHFAAGTLGEGWAWYLPQAGRPLPRITYPDTTMTPQRASGRGMALFPKRILRCCLVCKGWTLL